jgi:hypothetical protein
VFFDRVDRVILRLTGVNLIGFPSISTPVDDPPDLEPTGNPTGAVAAAPGCPTDDYGDTDDPQC